MCVRIIVVITQNFELFVLKPVAIGQTLLQTLILILIISTNRSLLAHLYWVLVHMGRHRVTPPICTVRKWSGHSQV